jgi:hypothetical protein
MSRREVWHYSNGSVRLPAWYDHPTTYSNDSTTTENRVEKLCTLSKFYKMLRCGCHEQFFDKLVNIFDFVFVSLAELWDVSREGRGARENSV